MQQYPLLPHKEIQMFLWLGSVGTNLRYSLDTAGTRDVCLVMKMLH